jgi:hypothetical protein
MNGREFTYGTNFVSTGLYFGRVLWEWETCTSGRGFPVGGYGLLILEYVIWSFFSMGSVVGVPDLAGELM